MAVASDAQAQVAVFYLDAAWIDTLGDSKAGLTGYSLATSICGNVCLRVSSPPPDTVCSRTMTKRGLQSVGCIKGLL